MTISKMITRMILIPLLIGTVVHATYDLPGPTSNLRSGGNFKKYLLKQAARESYAVCLDGSPGAYYFQPGTKEGRKKWYIDHQGGGWCESLQDCLNRSKIDLGSSKNFPDTMEMNGGVYSSDPTVNPLMYNWNKVFIRYCDGASFSGNNSTTTVYQGTNLHFRGMHIRQAVADDLFFNRGLDNATDVIIGGCSAGGLATFLHVDQWCDAFHEKNPTGKCVGIPDAGFFLDYQDPSVPCTPKITNMKPSSSTTRILSTLRNTIDGDYHCGLKWVFNIQNTTPALNPKCIEDYAQTNEEYKCIFAEHAAKYIKTPVFALQSQYDSWQVANLQGYGGDKKTNELGKNMTLRIKTNLMGYNNESGAFLDSCRHHCEKWNDIRIDGDLPLVAMKKWYRGIGVVSSKKIWFQNEAYPCDECCWT